MLNWASNRILTFRSCRLCYCKLSPLTSPQQRLPCPLWMGCFWAPPGRSGWRGLWNPRRSEDSFFSGLSAVSNHSTSESWIPWYLLLANAEGSGFEWFLSFPSCEFFTSKSPSKLEVIVSFIWVIGSQFDHRRMTWLAWSKFSSPRGCSSLRSSALWRWGVSRPFWLPTGSCPWMWGVRVPFEVILFCFGEAFEWGRPLSLQLEAQCLWRTVRFVWITWCLLHKGWCGGGLLCFGARCVYLVFFWEVAIPMPVPCLMSDGLMIMKWKAVREKKNPCIRWLRYTDIQLPFTKIKKLSSPPTLQIF